MSPLADSELCLIFAKLFSFGSWKNCWMVFKIKDLLLTRFSSTEVLWGCELSGDWGRLGPSDEIHFILEQVLRARLSPTRYERKQFKGLKQRMKKKRLVVRYMQQPRQADAQPPWAAGIWALVSESPEPGSIWNHGEWQKVVRQMSGCLTWN